MIVLATAEQIKSLVKSYVDRDDDKFKTVVLQIAAYEAKLGHDKLARDLKMLIEKAKNNRGQVVRLNAQNSMLDMTMPSHNLSELIVNNNILDKINRILIEYKNRKKLQSYGLTNRRKILLEGNPGTGKTLTASIVASELSLPLYTVQMDKLVTKFMGETSVKLRQIFDNIESVRGVYLFDEFDAIGADRSLDNEVGEMRRILNSFLQFIEQDCSDSIIIAATNNKKILDQALFRRFDDVLHYSLPTNDEVEKILIYKLSSYDNNIIITPELIKNAATLSQAEIVRVCDDAIKESILEETTINNSRLIYLINERHSIYKQREA